MSNLLTWNTMDSAPKDVRILVYMPGASDGQGQIHTAIWAKVANGYSWYVGHHFGFDCEPRTHWMPLPSPPEAS